MPRGSYSKSSGWESSGLTQPGQAAGMELYLELSRANSGHLEAVWLSQEGCRGVGLTWDTWR